MIIDFHTHIFPPEMIAARGRLTEQDGWFAEMYGNPKARMATADELVAEMGRCGIDLSVTSGFAFSRLDLCIEANDYVAESCRRFPDKIIGFTVVPRCTREPLTSSNAAGSWASRASASCSRTVRESTSAMPTASRAWRRGPWRTNSRS